ncbi:hypothetical protein ACIQU6_34155 [Streptomyces sp. NPDC090442]|uniref:hypothetical protein n=1 Tax=Streptomyces sp. NPDC090442 TaxID=3365962 RepID=UPI0038246787
MGRPSTLPTPSELFALLAKGTYRNQKEIADAYGVSEAAVSQRLAPYKESPIDYRALMPWETLSKHRTARPARALRLHLRAQLQPHTLTVEEEREHQRWLASLQTKIVDYTPEDGWTYRTRQTDHEDLVAILPNDVDLPTETIDRLYRLRNVG